MSKPVIAIDIDDVLLVSEPILADFYNRKFGTEITMADLHSGVGGALEALGHNRDEVIDNIEAFLLSQEFTKLSPIEGAVEGLNSLMNKYEIIAVTGRGSYLERETFDWLRKHFPDVFKSIHLVGEGKWGSGLKVEKQPVFLQHRVQAVVDDSLNTCRNAAANGINALLFGNYSWNQSAELPKGVQRVKDWDEVLKELLP